MGAYTQVTGNYQLTQDVSLAQYVLDVFSVLCILAAINCRKQIMLAFLVWLISLNTMVTSILLPKTGFHSFLRLSGIPL